MGMLIDQRDETLQLDDEWWVTVVVKGEILSGRKCDDQEAVRCYESAIRINPQYHQAYYGICISILTNSSIDNIMTNYHSIINKAEVYFKMGDMMKAGIWTMKLLAIFPKLKESWEIVKQGIPISIDNA